MARHNIKAVDLAKAMKVDTNTVSNLRTAVKMPRINGDRLDSLCDHLNDLSNLKDEVITPFTLIEYTPNKKVST